MADFSDILYHDKDKYILKHGKYRFLEKNLEQRCLNPFEWIYGDEIEFKCYFNKNHVKTYHIETIKTHYTKDEFSDIRNEKYKIISIDISKEDGEFAIKYGLESYLIWQMFNYSTKKRFLEEYNKKLIYLGTEINEDKRFYEEVHLMRNLLEEWLLEGTEDETLGSVVYTEEDKLFIEKYGEKYGDSSWKFWKELTEEEKSNYKELESYYTTYKELFENHYDDLKLYALMYRNVWLHNYYNDAISVIYFAKKYDEIVGYKKKLEEDRVSLKAQIALMFYENEALFPYVCEEYANVSLSKHTENTPLINALKRYKNFCIPYVFTIANMTEEQCKQILAHKENIRKDYLSLYGKYDYPTIEGYNDKIKFTTDYYISIIYSKYHYDGWCIRFISDKSFERNRTQRFLRIYFRRTGKKGLLEKEISNIKQCFDKVNEQIETLRKEHINVLNEITTIDNKIKELNRQCELELSCWEDPLYFLSYQEGEKIQDKQRQIRWKYIDLIQEQETKKHKLECVFKKIEKDLDKESIDKRIATMLIGSPVWNFVYNNYIPIKNYIEECNVRAYNICWIRNPNKMRNLEKHGYYASSFYGTSWLMGMKAEISNMYETLFSKWINSKKEQEEIEEQKRLEQSRLQEEIKTEKFRFNKRNHHYLDDRIIFHKADHSYSVNGVYLESVTTFVSNCFPKFDMRLHAKQKSEKTGVSFEFIFNKWKEMGIESRNLGTAMHSKIENYYLGNDSEETDAYKLFKIFADKVELKPYRTEWSVYDWEHKIAGTIDFVDYQNGEYIIYDWKRSEKIIENGMPVKINKYGEKGNYPLEHLDNTPYYHYALQLSLYKYILEKNYGIKVSDLRLGIFHPTYNKPYVLRMPYLEKEINDIFSLRSEVIF